MNTLTIESNEKLSRNIFKSFEDLIEEYYKSRGLIQLHRIDEANLPLDLQKKLQESEKLGENELLDFKG